VELRGRGETILIANDFSAALVDSLKCSYKEALATSAVAKALDYLRKHFEKRGSALPFQYDLLTGKATALNPEYIDFVSDAQDQRTTPKEAKNFEIATSRHLATRLTGSPSSGFTKGEIQRARPIRQVPGYVWL